MYLSDTETQQPNLPTPEAFESKDFTDLALDIIFNSQGSDKMYANLKALQVRCGASEDKFKTYIKKDLYESWDDFDGEWMDCGFESEGQFVSENMEIVEAAMKFEL